MTGRRLLGILEDKIETLSFTLYWKYYFDPMATDNITMGEDLQILNRIIEIIK